MRKFSLCWLAILLLALEHSAFSAIRPAFRLDYSSWHATHIILVTTTSADGTFEVMESWKGDLPVGDRLVIPELRSAPNAVPISNYPRLWEDALRGGVSELIPREPPGSRMILFLKRSAVERGDTDRSDRTARGDWRPSDILDTMKASVLWIDGDQVYCFTQLINPGPSVLFLLPHSEAIVRNRVAEINDIQENEIAAAAAADGELRAERLKPYVRSDVFPAQQFALAELGKSGPSAVRTILGMLDDPAFVDESPELVKALVGAGGETVGAELNDRLRKDLSFWRSTAPSLSKDWWNEDARIHAPLRERYEHTYQLIVGLEQARYAGALSTATQLRDFWRSLPQLNDPSGLNQMTEECDKLISHVQSR
jgi:hypothetical protein